MKSNELVAKAIDIANNHKTLYVMGCFGAPMTDANKERYTSNHSYNRDTVRTVMIKSATENTFGFDCSGLVKGILWGWAGKTGETYGGVSYASNGVPDLSADAMIAKCTDVSTGFTSIQPGELLWMSGHVGIYIGNGEAVECTPSWKNGVQVTTVRNMKSGTGHKWTKHGKLPYVDYSVTTQQVTVSGTASTGSETDEKTIWAFLKGKGLNDFAIAGVMGNLYAESLLESTNLQNSYENRLGYTDASYTAAVDNGSYSNFVRDAAGYGLAQWTYWSRKQALLNYAKEAKKSIGDLQMQLAFLWKEMQGYNSMMKVLKSARTVKEASDIFMVKFEAPADQSSKAKANRASFGQKYYDKYAGEPEGAETTQPVFKKGDIITLTEDATYYGGRKIPDWVKDKQWVVLEDSIKDRAIIDKSVDGGHSICSPVHVQHLKAVKAEASPDKVDYAGQYDEELAGEYSVTPAGGLHLRSGADREKASLEVMASGSKVTCYGYHTGDWLYVVSESGKTGFCHSDYLTKA